MFPVLKLVMNCTKRILSHFDLITQFIGIVLRHLEFYKYIYSRVMSPDQKEISLNRASRWSRPFLIFHPPEKSASSILLSRFFLHIGCRYGVSPQISFFNGMKVSYKRNNHRLCDTLQISFFSKWTNSVKGWS